MSYKLTLKFSAAILAISLAVSPVALAATKITSDGALVEQPVSLNAREKQALAVVKQADANPIKPFQGKDGTVQYVFGAQTPNLVCALLKVCDVSLEAGEHISSVQLGDSARWNVQAATSGTGANAVQHLFLKPLDVNLSTNLVITTDRRVYHINLKSDPNQYMPQISFTYPEANFDSLQFQQQLAQQRQQETLPQTSEYLGDLSFDYKVTGNAPWKPIRVYTDGKKTIIQMPKAMAMTEAPILLDIDKKGGFLRPTQTSLVNYRVQGDRYIVDKVLLNAMLVSGVGSSQYQVVITKTGV